MFGLGYGDLGHQVLRLPFLFLQFQFFHFVENQLVVLFFLFVVLVFVVVIVVPHIAFRNALYRNFRKLVCFFLRRATVLWAFAGAHDPAHRWATIWSWLGSDVTRHSGRLRAALWRAFRCALLSTWPGTRNWGLLPFMVNINVCYFLFKSFAACCWATSNTTLTKDLFTK